MKKILTVLIIIVGVFALITQGITIYISNTSAADSILATKLDAELEKVAENNINLESKILRLASYNAVASRAAELGYKASRDFVSVYDPLEVALGR